MKWSIVFVVLFMASPILASLLIAGLANLFDSSRIAEYAVLGYYVFYTVPIGGVVLIGMFLVAVFSRSGKSGE